MRLSIPLLMLVIVQAAGCAAMSPPPVKAKVTMEPKSASSVAGEVLMTETRGVVHAHIALKGLAPGSEHGFHVHEKGDCSAADATSAGGHFNPAGSAHGRAGSAVHHAGDLPSLTADASGNVRTDLVLEGVTLGAGPNSMVGRSLVVHGGRDDYTTQPTGNSGPRVACGVVVAR